MPDVAESDLEPELERLAGGLVAAIEAADVDAWLAAFSADAVTWHSNSGHETPATANAEGLRGMFALLLERLRYVDVRRHRIADGYVQQHTLTMTARNGASFRRGVCMVVHVADGRITRLEEYLDSSVFAFAQEAAGAG